jgi:hypothetical protein
MGYEPIENHGIVGDMHSAALVSLDGSVDWLCLPRFDSPSVFGAILKSLRVTTWSASSSFRCMMSILSLTPTTARRSSLYRLEPLRMARRMSGFHFPLTRGSHTILWILDLLKASVRPRSGPDSAGARAARR